MNKYKYVLFDLDGTISESALGVRKSIEYTINKFNKTMPDLEDYTLYIGPPIYDTFKNVCKFKDDEIEEAISVYRENYDSVGKLYNKLYNGIEDLLKQLKKNKIKIAVCSSKYEKFAYEIIEILGVKEYFDAVCGSTPDASRQDKAQLIPYAISSLGGDIKEDYNKTLMIGDTYFDAEGARLCKVDFIGVEYGYGDKEKMIAEGATKFIKTPLEILPHILP